MGNYLSCTTLANKAPGGRRCARAILPDGAVRPVPLPATAAEVMMDAPGHFLVDARAAAPGARLAALPADEELELGAVYAAFPMKRLGTVLAPADVARLEAAAAREARRGSSAAASAKVSDGVAPDQAPAGAEVVEGEEQAPRRVISLEEMVVDDAAAAAELGALKHRLSSARSRRPTLETIQEENYMSSLRAY